MQGFGLQFSWFVDISVVLCVAIKSFLCSGGGKLLDSRPRAWKQHETKMEKSYR
jgi:hypothetical protein